MGLFRRRAADPAGLVPDPVFAFLTTAQGTRLRRLAQEAFAEAGVEVVVEPDHLVASDGRVFGLANLAANVHAGDRERDWPKVVRRHVGSVLRATRDGVDLRSLPAEEVLGRVFLRATGLTTMPPESRAWTTYARAVGGDIVETLAYDEPESVRMLTDDDVARFGADRLRAAGLENLLRDPLDEVRTVQAPDGGSFQLVSGASVYTASRVLAMTDLLRRVYGERDYPHGVLVGVPFRHQVLLHPLDGREAVPSFGALAVYTGAGFDDGVAPVSGYVYWWDGAGITPVGHLGENGPVIYAEGAFADAFSQATGFTE